MKRTLSELIRKGCRTTKKTEGRLFNRVAYRHQEDTVPKFFVEDGIDVEVADKVRTPEDACAVGAGVVGYHKERLGVHYPPFDKLYSPEELNDVLSTPIHPNHIPDDYGHQSTALRLQNVITGLNDQHSFSRERIADWLDALIYEHGYDLYVEVEEHGEEEGDDDDEYVVDELTEETPSGDSVPDAPNVEVNANKEEAKAA